MRLSLALSPAMFTFALTLVVSFVTGHPEDLFLTRSIVGIPVRFIIITLILATPVLILPKVVALTGNLAKNEAFFGQLVKAAASPDQECCKPIVWGLRPLQGIGLHMIFAERFLDFLEFSVGASYAAILARQILFLIGSGLVSIFLSVVWALDDLGVRIYNRGTGEVHMAGRTMGTILPLFTGAIGVSSLFHHSLPLDALIDLVEIFMVLYPPYVVFVIFHHKFVRRRFAALSEKLRMRAIETEVRWIWPAGLTPTRAKDSLD